MGKLVHYDQAVVGGHHDQHDQTVVGGLDGYDQDVVGGHNNQHDKAVLVGVDDHDQAGEGYLKKLMMNKGVLVMARER